AINETYLSIEAEEGTTEYSLTFNYHDRNTDEELFLFDAKTREFVTISADSSVYHFRASATDNGVKRFQIIARKAVTDLEDKEVEVFHLGGSAFFYNRSDNTAEIAVLDISGRRLQHRLQLGSGETKTFSSLPKGVYVVEISVGGRKHSEKVIM
ncbi:MAG: T9SS type A sorting domain-containing protein, partial [Prevotellaceae bacterium]|nr:T9SS type A sorting domain-containing protein [Prevotellaceae bacterium]